MRLRSGAPLNIDGDSVSAAETDALMALSAGGQWQRSHTASEAELDALRSNGEARTGRPLPDLNNYMRLELPHGHGCGRCGAAYAALDSVEGAYLIPKPAPVADVDDYAIAGSVSGNPVTDPYQGYLDAAPAGVDARWAWDGIHGSGSGIRICDVEYDYNASHKDLPDVTFVGDPKDPPFSDDHGTAVLSIMGGQANTWGVKGIAYGASYYFAAAKTTTGGYDVGNGVIECMNALNPGDVIIIEQQTARPQLCSRRQQSVWPCAGGMVQALVR
jgi:serine protease